MNREIKTSFKYNISLIECDDWIHVSVKQKQSDLLFHFGPGDPSSAYDLFKVKLGTTDEEIIKYVSFYCMGHEQGWRDGQWKLQKDLRGLLRVNP